MIAVAAFVVGAPILAMLLVAVFVAGFWRASTRKAAFVVLGLLVAGVMFMRVSTVHYTEPPVALMSEAGDDQPATVDERPMDVEQASTPPEQPSIQRTAQSLVAHVVPEGIRPAQVRLFISGTIEEPMRRAMVLALNDRFPNANVIRVTNLPDSTPADRELDLFLQITSSYSRAYGDHTTQGWRYELTAITASGRTTGTAWHQETEWQRGRPAAPAPHFAPRRAPIAPVIGTLALILLLYLGLNAWTRGYFQTRLRFLAGALFLLAVVLVMLLA